MISLRPSSSKDPGPTYECSQIHLHPIHNKSASASTHLTIQLTSQSHSRRISDPTYTNPRYAATHWRATRVSFPTTPRDPECPSSLPADSQHYFRQNKALSSAE